MSIDHPDLRVFVLDDGARGFVRDLAHELGAHYVFRVKGKHAKAGNVNNGLAHALSAGRRPAFILLLDADFVPGVICGRPQLASVFSDALNGGLRSDVRPDCAELFVRWP